LIVLLSIGCSSSTKPRSNTPQIPPGAIHDLHGEDRGSDGVMLRWSAPTAGSAAVARYDVRLANEPINDSNWADADTVAGEPVPAASGSPESLLVGGLDGQTTYHFAIRSLDAASRASQISNDHPFLTKYGALTSIDGVIADFGIAWNTLDYTEYTRLFDSAYTFVFAPQDLGGPDNNPAYWGVTDELSSAQHLYSRADSNHAGYVATSASLTFTVGPEIPNDIENWTKVVLSQVFLTVESRERDAGDLLDYLVPGDEAYFWFVQSGNVWHIIRWEDKPIPTRAALTEATTFGKIKGLWSGR
jgi:hypothetical protein